MSNFFNVAANFWGKIGCCAREKTPALNEMPQIKPKKDFNQVSTNEVLNTPSNLNDLSQLSLDSNENVSYDMTTLSYPIKFSGNPKGKTWTKEEDELLKEAVKHFNGKSWKKIASKVPGRSSTQCSQRWRRIQPYKNRFPWTSEEDQLLADLVYKYGQNWSIIASSLSGRTGKQVRERYLNNLDPTINRSKFSAEEDEKIIELYSVYGPKWKEMTKDLCGRTENMIKNRFYSHIKKKLLLKYPQKYKKALEKAQTEISGNNLSSPAVIKKSLKNENGIESEMISSKDDFSEIEENFKQKFQQIEYQTLDFMTKNNLEFKGTQETHHGCLIDHNGQGIEIEDAPKINDGFLNLYHTSNETPKKNDIYRSIFSPMNHKIADIAAFDAAAAIKQEMDIESLKIEPVPDYQKYEGDLLESKNAILNNFFNIKEFEARDLFGKSSGKSLEEIKDSNSVAVSNQSGATPVGEKLLTQKNYLLTKKARLESMIKQLAGKIKNHSNTQQL